MDKVTEVTNLQIDATGTLRLEGLAGRVRVPAGEVRRLVVCNSPGLQALDVSAMHIEASACLADCDGLEELLLSSDPKGILLELQRGAGAAELNILGHFHRLRLGEMDFTPSYARPERCASIKAQSARVLMAARPGDPTPAGPLVGVNQVIFFSRHSSRPNLRRWRILAGAWQRVIRMCDLKAAEPPPCDTDGARFDRTEVQLLDCPNLERVEGRAGMLRLIRCGKDSLDLAGRFGRAMVCDTLVRRLTVRQLDRLTLKNLPRLRDVQTESEISVRLEGKVLDLAAALEDLAQQPGRLASLVLNPGPSRNLARGLLARRGSPAFQQPSRISDPAVVEALLAVAGNEADREAAWITALAILGQEFLRIHQPGSRGWGSPWRRAFVSGFRPAAAGFLPSRVLLLLHSLDPQARMAGLFRKRLARAEGLHNFTLLTDHLRQLRRYGRPDRVLEQTLVDLLGSMPLAATEDSLHSKKSWNRGKRIMPMLVEWLQWLVEIGHGQAVAGLARRALDEGAIGVALNATMALHGSGSAASKDVFVGILLHLDCFVPAARRQIMAAVLGPVQPDGLAPVAT
ncbi:MAG: hypothetical protein EA370_12305 [Wenzhouxiangella sp.]|nr:MAG: hypothetical protein EA370_12305 [Wenzhouxiangella sp.]